METKDLCQKSDKKFSHNVVTNNFWVKIQPKLLPDIKATLESKEWNFKHSYQTTRALVQIIQSECEDIQVKYFESLTHITQGNKKYHSIFHWFSRIQFTSLKILVLKTCSIDNVEILAFLKIQLLEQLQMSNCKISCMKPINKINLPRLKHMNISDTRIGVLMMGRAKVSNEFENIKIERLFYVIGYASIQDLSSILKLSPTKIDLMSVPRRQYIIFHRQTLKRIYQKYPGLGISWKDLIYQYAIS